MLSFVCAWISGVWAHGDYHDAVDEIGRALDLEPDNADLHFRLAVACQEHGEWTSALVALEKTERLAPGKHPVGLIQGLALSQGGQWQAAETVLSEFLAAHPNHPLALTERARMKLKLARPEEALADFRVAVLNSTRLEPDLFLEAAEALVSQGYSTEAAAVLNRGIEKLGNLPELLEHAVEVEAADGQLDAAIKHVDALAQSAQQPQEWQARKARLLDQAGRQEASQTVWRDLKDRLLALPNLERGQPHISLLLQEAQTALGEQSLTAVVIAPPAPVSPSPSQLPSPQSVPSRP